MAWKHCVHSVFSGAERKKERKCKKKRCPLSCQHERWYNTVGVSNIHSKAALQSAAKWMLWAKYERLEHNQKPKSFQMLSECRKAFLFFFERERIPFFTSNLKGLQQCCYLSVLVYVTLILYTLIYYTNFHIFGRTLIWTHILCLDCMSL